MFTSMGWESTFPHLAHGPRSLVGHRPTSRQGPARPREGRSPWDSSCDRLPAGVYVRRNTVAATVGLVPAILHGLAMGPPPCPRAVGVDLQHRVILLDEFGGCGQVDRGDGILSQPLERLPNLVRSERGVDTVQEGKPRAREDDP